MKKEEYLIEFDSIKKQMETFPDNIVYKVIDYNKLRDTAESDMKLNKDTLTKNQLENAVLHSRYYRIMEDFGKKYRHVEKLFNKLYSLKYEYYKYYSKLELGYQEVLIYLKGDNDINFAQSIMDEYEENIRYLKELCSRIKNRSYEIKNIIEWEKFLVGEK